MLNVATRRHRGRLVFRRAPLQPPSDEWFALDDRVPDSDLARAISAALGRLDIVGLWDLYHGAGSPAYPPDRLLACVLYEIRQGHHSPAQWHRHAAQVDPLRWLLRGFTPSRSCWYNFKARLGEILPKLNKQLLHQLDALALVPARRGTLDGTLIAAAASRHRLVNQETLTRRLAVLVLAVAKDESDQPSEGEAGPEAKQPGWLASTVKGRQGQWRAYQRAESRLGQLQAENQQRKKSKRRPAAKLVVSLSDPEAALGWDKQKVFRPLYNVQLLNDVDAPFVLGYQVVAQVNDAGLMKGMLQSQREMVGRQVAVLLADSGYAAGADLAAADAAGVTVYAPWQSNDYSDGKRSGKSAKQIPKGEFLWSEAENAYRCPEGKRLGYDGTMTQRRQTSGKVTLKMYRARPEDCQGCPRRGQCTAKAEAGRSVSRSEHDGRIEELRERMGTEQGKELYKLRRQAGERLNADFKQHRKLRGFSGRGLSRVTSEVGLTVLCQNLIAGEEERRKAHSSSRTAGTSSRDSG